MTTGPTLLEELEAKAKDEAELVELVMEALGLSRAAAEEHIFISRGGTDRVVE